MPATKKDLKFMQMAFQEMRKSRSEHAHKHDPMVGAVLIGRDGRYLGGAHRGDLRVGDHAEFTLIERLLGNKDLQGSTLYVTLEPCTQRTAPKVPCAERVVAARVARVVMGMVDPNPDIEGHGVAYLQQKGVEVDFFDLDLCERIRTENKDFIEQYKRAEKPPPEQEEYAGPSVKEKEAVPSAGVEDFSPDAIKDYLAARKKSFRVPSRQLWDFFESNGFVTRHGRRGSFAPTVAGLLLFGKSPEDALVQSKVKAEVHKGEKIKAVDIGGPLLSMPERIKAFLEEYGPTYTVIKDFKRIEEPEYPWDAVREALVNAIVHRDYTEGARVFVQLLRDRLVIKSPGLPLRPLSLAKIRAYNAPPFSRNPRVADTFSHMKWMEERGWGFTRMRDLLVSHGLPAPQFAIDGGYFVVTFLGQERASVTVRIPPEVWKGLVARKRRILEFVRKQGRINRAECMAALKVDRNAAQRLLSQLVKLGLLEPRGKGPAAHYILIGS